MEKGKGVPRWGGWGGAVTRKGTSKSMRTRLSNFPKVSKLALGS